jgi:hypothetical protein
MKWAGNRLKFYKGIGMVSRTFNNKSSPEVNGGLGNFV